MANKTRMVVLTAGLLCVAGSCTLPSHAAVTTAAKVKPSAPRIATTLRLRPSDGRSRRNHGLDGAWLVDAGCRRTRIRRTGGPRPQDQRLAIPPGQALEGFFIEGSGRFNEGGPPASDEREFALVLALPFGDFAQTMTRNFSRALSNPLFPPATATTHSIDVQLHNICDEAGESVSISVEVVVVAIP